MHNTVSVLTEPICIVDGAHGIYVPQIWGERYGTAAVAAANVSADDVADILTGPDSDTYWDSWDSVLNDYCHTVDGVRHYLTQDGDLFEFPETYNWDD